jgi:hypothetical protein
MGTSAWETALKVTNFALIHSAQTSERDFNLIPRGIKTENNNF